MGIGVQRGDRLETIEVHSERAEIGSGGRRWFRRLRMGAWVGGMRRMRRPVDRVKGLVRLKKRSRRMSRFTLE